MTITSNPFSTTFGRQPDNYISRLNEQNQIMSEFSSSQPSNYVYLLTGVRGSGKTVLLSAIAKHFIKEQDWIVVDPGPKDNILENIAAEIYETGRVKHLFLESEFSFSFQGLTFSIKGKTPITTVNSLLKKMLDQIKKKNKKVLITIDEVDNSPQMKLFIQAYQSLIRLDYPVMLLMTGLYENVSKLQEDKTLTFLYRAPKINLGPLSLNAIAGGYQRYLEVTDALAVDLAKLTKGYAYAYQVLGYLFFQKKKKEIDAELLADYDQYLSEYVYEKVFSGLSLGEQEILKSFVSDDPMKVDDLRKKRGLTASYFSNYRAKLIKEGNFCN
jgi:predicted AAA+ superfamily ATPase